MKNLSPSLFILSFFISCSTGWLQAAETEANLVSNKSEAPPLQTVVAKSEPRTNPQAPQVSAPKFQPFTGKITKNKVRLRLQPTFDGIVLRELHHNDLVVILGETDDFYAIQAPTDFKAYVFRTYVLDNVIEGSRVNVRLRPELDAPVVAQLNSGVQVEGIIHPSNTKWLEIKIPDSARFYIAKEYVERAGDSSFKARQEKKHDEVAHLLTTTEAISKTEMQKPFDHIHIDGMKNAYQHIMNDFPEFPDLGNKARVALTSLQEAYTAKKLAHLENQSRMSYSTMEVNKKLSAELEEQKNKVTHLEQQIENNRQLSQPIVVAAPASDNKPAQLPVNMSTWVPIEEILYHRWVKQTGKQSPQDFYDEQKNQGIVLNGVIDAYTRPVKNKPGDYMLLSETSKLPVAFLYSTHINLQDYIGHEVSMVVSQRENNNFAFPAYFVLLISK